MTAIVLHAPFDGWVTRLDAVPDPVFAERMMGDGLAVEPLEGVLHAPCDGTVASVAATAHALTLVLANGAELLIHLGLETVAMQGAGFVALVSKGAQVSQGAPLIRFDLDRIAAEAKSAITPMTIANDGYVLTPIVEDAQVAAGAPILRVAPAAAPATAAAPLNDDTGRCTITVPLANGIHARPAARIVAALKPFAAEVAVDHPGGTANARSIVALLGAGIGRGNEITIVARGGDARAAVAAVATLIESGMGEAGEPHAPPAPEPETRGNGVSASPGFAVGPAFVLRLADIELVPDGAGIAAERAALAAGCQTVGDALASDGSDIAAAHRALLDDPQLLAAADREIAEGRSAGFAWRVATRGEADRLRRLENPLLAERAADLVDLERQVIAAITGKEAAMPVPPAGAIVLAEELLPSQVGPLVAAGVSGICTAGGGPTSHAAILAASAGVPMVVAAGRAVLAVQEGQMVILDADHGLLDATPDAARLEQARARAGAAAAAQRTRLAAAQAECRMADGTRIEVFANLAGVDDARRAVPLGAEGSGLLRTEFLFLGRDTAPDEDEQVSVYREIAEALEGRPLIVRTLDVGGDKPLGYLPFPAEENPALGNRGIRFSLARPELFEEQVRAILRAVPGEQCRIMLPMITDRGEFRRARAIVQRAADAIGLDRLPPLGVMIETPAAAMLADTIAEEAEFLSIGSNDLTQYVLAADRGNVAVAPMVDALHPAVLRLIGEAGRGAARHGRWLGVCGAIASDPQAAAILIGLGVTELSAAPGAIPAIKERVRMLSLAQCRALAERACACATAGEVRALIEEGR